MRIKINQLLAIIILLKYTYAIDETLPTTPQVSPREADFSQPFHNSDTSEYLEQYCKPSNTFKLWLVQADHEATTLFSNKAFMKRIKRLYKIAKSITCFNEQNIANFAILDAFSISLELEAVQKGYLENISKPTDEFKSWLQTITIENHYFTCTDILLIYLEKYASVLRHGSEVSLKNFQLLSKLANEQRRRLELQPK